MADCLSVLRSSSARIRADRSEWARCRRQGIAQRESDVKAFRGEERGVAPTEFNPVRNPTHLYS